MKIDHLSDDELRQQLVANGVNAGPITDSTRAVYIKKLAKIIASAPSNVPANPVDFAGEHDHRIPEEPTVLKGINDVIDTPEPRQRKHRERMRLTNEPQENDFEEGEESMRFLTEEEMLNDMNRSRLPTPEPTRPSILPGILRVILLVVVVIFLFFLLEETVKGNKENL